MKKVVFAALLFGCKSDGQPTTVVIAPTAAASQSSTPGTLLSPTAGPADTCSRDSDCTWGEIDREIASPKDCMCLLGCPGIAMNVTTESRRRAQYAKQCKPGMDGEGHGCPIDDCAAPPPIRCVAGKCGR